MFWQIMENRIHGGKLFKMIDFSWLFEKFLNVMDLELLVLSIDTNVSISVAL